MSNENEQSFTHIILTRFNVLKDDWNSDWLIDRLYLFKNYCYPTIISQSNKNFKWLVFFSYRTPLRIRNEINELSINFKNFYPVFVKDYFNQYRDIIKSFINKDSEFLITSRVDADDGYSFDYVDEIQKIFYKLKSQVVINYNRGLVYSKSDNKLYIRNHYINAFCTLIENSENIETVWVKDHRELGQLFNIKKVISKKPMWIQVVHNNNLSNIVRSDSYRVSLKKVPDRIIGINFNTKTDSNFIIILLVNILLYPKYLLTIFIRPIKRYLADMLRVVRKKGRKFS